MDIETKDGVRTNQEIFPFEIEYLPDFFQKKAEKEICETPENRKKGLKLIRQMARQDKHFNGLDFDEDFLLQYLRCHKYDVAKAFSRLRAFVMLRKKNPEIFTGLHFDTHTLNARTKLLTILPKRCPDGCSVILVRLDNWNPEELPLEEVKRTLVLFLVQSCRYPMTQVNGFKVIFDVKSNPIRHLRYVTPSNMYLMYHGSQECVGGRFKEIHGVNTDSLTFKVGWFFLKYILPAKIKERIHIHRGPEKLLNYFPRSILPVEYGGELEDWDTTEWLSKVTQPESVAALEGRVANN